MPDVLYKALLNAIPLPVFVVDEDVVIRDANEAAEDFFGTYKDGLKNRRGGDILHCLNSFEDLRGCGKGVNCSNCVIRGSVTATFKGNSISRRRMKIQVFQKAKLQELELLITACPIDLRMERLSLLILEDITAMSTLKQIIPICMKCKKIRDDQEYWKHVETYFHEFIGVDFSHGICPHCAKEMYPELIGDKRP